LRASTIGVSLITLCTIVLFASIIIPEVSQTLEDAESEDKLSSPDIPIGLISIILLLGLLGPAVAVLYNGYRESEREQIREIRMQENREFASSIERNRIIQRQRIREQQIINKQREAQKRKALLTQTLECKTKHEDEVLREFIPGDGLFDIAVTKFDVPSFAEQVEAIKALKQVITFDPTTKTTTLNLGSYGIYEVVIEKKPRAKRTDPSHISHDNPFINCYSNTLCLGTATDFYDETFRKGNYHECLRIIIKILSSDDDSDGYRGWSECR